MAGEHQVSLLQPERGEDSWRLNAVITFPDNEAH